MAAGNPIGKVVDVARFGYHPGEFPNFAEGAAYPTNEVSLSDGWVEPISGGIAWAIGIS